MTRLIKVVRAGAGLIVVVGAAVFAAWWFTRSAVPAVAAAAVASADTVGNPVMLTPLAERRIGVTYAAVQRGAIAFDVQTVAVVTPDERRVKAIAPRVEGWIEELNVATTGQQVTANDPLLRIYSPVLVTAQEDLVLARKLLGDASNADSSARASAASLVTGARRRLRNLDVAEEDIARIEHTGDVQRTITLRSPVSGVVVQKNVLAGQRVTAGDSLYRIADLSEVWLEGNVFERDLSAVHVGQEVTAEIAAVPGRAITGRIIYVSPTVSEETRTTVVRVAVPNADLALKPGMYATMHIRGGGAAALNVPRSAVMVTGTRAVVFVKSADGMLYPREVSLGRSTDDRAEITRGLALGDTVVASATFLIDAESNLGSAMAGMANMPGMSKKQ